MKSCVVIPSRPGPCMLQQCNNQRSFLQRCRSRTQGWSTVLQFQSSQNSLREFQGKRVPRQSQERTGTWFCFSLKFLGPASLCPAGPNHLASGFVVTFPSRFETLLQPCRGNVFRPSKGLQPSILAQQVLRLMFFRAVSGRGAGRFITCSPEARISSKVAWLAALKSCVAMARTVVTTITFESVQPNFNRCF